MAEAKFPIIIDDQASGPAKQASDSMLKLRDAILQGQSKIRDYNEEMRRLKGSSDDVVKAKNELKAKINQEASAVTSASLALQKEGVTLGQLNTAVKKAAAAEADLAKQATATASATVSASAKESAAVAGAGKAHDGASSAIDKVRDALDGTNAVSKGTMRDFGDLKSAVTGAGGAVGVATIAFVAMAAAIVAISKAAVEGAIALGKFIITNANTQRTALLTQEGLLGSAAAAKNFTDQVNDLAKRVPTAKDELTKLGDELAGKGLKGQPLVDAMNAIAQTASAKGEAAGDKLKAQLVASLGGGAKAARLAAEKEFGNLNARKMLDLDVQAQRFKETLSSLTRDVNLDPLLKALNEILSFFDESTSSGAALKDLVTIIGNGLSSAASESAPILKAAMKQLLIYTLEGIITFLQLKRQISEAFGPDNVSGVDAMNVVLAVAKFAITAMVDSLIASYAVWRLIEAAIGYVGQELQLMVDAAGAAKKALTAGWDAVGKMIVTGLASGITGSGGALTGAITGLADKVKSGFKSALGIHSPSTVFAEFGEQTAAGFEQGVSGDAGASASSAVTTMAQPPGGGGRGGGGGNAIGELHLHVEVGGGGNPQAVAAAVSQPSVLAAISKILDDAVAGAGLAPAPGGA